MYTPSHTQRHPTPVVSEQPSSESRVQPLGSLEPRGAPVHPVLTQLHARPPGWSVSVLCEASGS